MVALHTRLLWVLMRLVDSPRMAELRARRWFAPARWLLERGVVSVLGGIGVRQQLRASGVPPWGAQAYGVLTGEHEVQVQQAMRRLVREGDVVWDVGANIGAMALIAGRIVGPSGSVLAIEPDPDCVEAIRANVALNDAGWIEVLPAAAAARSGPVDIIVVSDRLWTRLATVGAHEFAERTIPVDGIALDDLDRPPPALVKIDVEGGELDVLAGMQRLLRDARPHVICEMHGRNAEFCEVMRAAGYSVTNLDDPEPVQTAGGNVHALCSPV
jgi:FkbM family methyltransferase